MPNHSTVALASTVISHGLPYPHNLRLALRLEEIVREAGAAPATGGVRHCELPMPPAAWVTRNDCPRTEMHPYEAGLCLPALLVIEWNIF